MNDLDTLFVQWKQATADLKWGVRKAFRDVFQVAADGGTTLVYGSDYRDGYPCLVNTVGSMLSVGGGNGIPSTHFGEVVRLFDEINRELYSRQVNTRSGYVSPVAADVFLHHFSTDGDDAIDHLDSHVFDALAAAHNLPVQPYQEMSDEAMARALTAMFTQPDAPCDIVVDGTDHRIFSVDPLYNKDVEFHGATTGRLPREDV